MWPFILLLFTMNKLLNLPQELLPTSKAVKLIREKCIANIITTYYMGFTTSLVKSTHIKTIKKNTEQNKLWNQMWFSHGQFRKSMIVLCYGKGLTIGIIARNWSEHKDWQSFRKWRVYYTRISKRLLMIGTRKWETIGHFQLSQLLVTGWISKCLQF